MSHPEETLLLDYVLREPLDPVVLEGLEQHLFACPACARRAAAQAELVDGLHRGLSRLPPVVVSDAQLARLEGALRVQCATIGAFEQRPERVASDSQLFVTRVKVSMTGVDRLDVRLCDGEGVPFLELSDVPFEPQAPFINLTCDSHIARRNPRFRVQLTGLIAGAQVSLADCVFQQEA